MLQEVNGHVRGPGPLQQNSWQYLPTKIDSFILKVAQNLNRKLPMAYCIDKAIEKQREIALKEKTVREVLTDHLRRFELFSF